MSSPSSRAILVLIAASSFVPVAEAQRPVKRSGSAQSASTQVVLPRVACDTRTPSEWVPMFEAAVAAGEVPDPAQRVLPPTAPVRGASTGDSIPCLTREQVFLFEDTGSVLAGNPTFPEVLTVMTDASNALVATHGDDFDFIGFFTCYPVGPTLGFAFYNPVFNDVTGIGDAFGVPGVATFDERASLGLGSTRIEGYVFMNQVQGGFWLPGSVPLVLQTRLILAHEFDHRYGTYLPPLSGGRALQGLGDGCGNEFHWNHRVDGQGASTCISEWVGSSPAVLAGSAIRLNTDHAFSTLSFPDLYLQGYVTGAEMDVAVAELRYMENSDCFSGYNGPVSHFTSADIEAAAGPRVPDAAAERKHYRCGWVLLHLPGALPTGADLDFVVGILEQQQRDWRYATLGRGSIDNTLFDDCNCDGAADAGPGACAGDPELYCSGKANTLACLPFLSSAGRASVSPPTTFTVFGDDFVPGSSGLMVYGVERANLDFHGAKLCVKAPQVRLVPAQIAQNAGTPDCSGRLMVEFNRVVQAGSDPALTVGQSVTAQFIQQDPGHPDAFDDNLSNAIQFSIGP